MTVRIGAVVLAAGMSRRMGKRNKLLAIFEGQPVLRRVVETVQASAANDLVVITGFEAEKVARSLDGLGVRLVHTPHFADGLSASLRAGIQTLPADIDGALIVLGDMPRLKSTTIDILARHFRDGGTETICVPAHQGRPGNPVLWPSACFPAILSLSGDAGARRLMDTFCDRVTEINVDDSGIHFDIDDPADLEAS